MIYRQMARLAWRNVLRNWRHSLATLLAIASGFMAVSLFDGFIKELQERNNDGYSRRGMLGHLVIQKKDADKFGYDDQWLYSLDTADQRFLEDFFAKDSDFLRRVRFLNVAGLVTAGPNNAVFVGFGIDLEEAAAVRGERWAWNTTAGVPLHLAKQPSVILGTGLGLFLECVSRYQGPPFHLEDGNYVAEERPFDCKTPRVTLSATTEAAQVNAIDLPVAGLYDAGFRELDKRAINISLPDAQRLFDTDKISMVSVQLRDESALPAFIDRLQAAAAADGRQLDVMPWIKHPIAAYVKGGFQILDVFRNLFMTIVVAIGVMSVANTMMKSVNERIREIGTLRSLGFFRRHLIFMFSCEGFFLSLIACALGLVATVLVSLLISRLGITYRAGILAVPILLKVRYAPLAWGLSLFFLSLLATATAWFCSRRAARMVVAEALRHA